MAAIIDCHRVAMIVHAKKVSGKKANNLNQSRRWYSNSWTNDYSSW